MIISKHNMNTLMELSLEKCYTYLIRTGAETNDRFSSYSRESHNTYHDMCAFKVQPWNKLVQRM